jgi:hypothetical protein
VEVVELKDVGHAAPKAASAAFHAELNRLVRPLAVE